jgi:hypothetical protein
MPYKKDKTEKSKKDKPNKKNKKDYQKNKFHSCNALNQVMSFFHPYLKNFDLRKHYLYQLIHTIYIWAVGAILLFNCNLVHLIVLLIIISLDAVSIVILHECPLSILERRYCQITLADFRSTTLKNSGIAYNCNHEYEKQIELLINIWTLIAGKCMGIVALNMLNIKIIDKWNVYV